MTADNRTNKREALIAELQSANRDAIRAKFMYLAFQKDAERAQQRLLEHDAVTLNLGDAEPGVRPFRDYLGADGRVWYKTVLDGWRYRGHCLYGTPWDQLPEAIFPLKELVGTQLKERGL